MSKMSLLSSSHRLPPPRPSLLLVGLGNPGYSGKGLKISRHNVGEAFLHFLHERNHFGSWKNLSGCFSSFCESDEIIIVRPWLPMNQSGKAVAKVLEYFVGMIPFYSYPLPTTVSVISTATKQQQKQQKEKQQIQLLRQRLLVVHDDLEKQFGKFSLKACGSAGGHRGVLSIIEYLKSDEFYRLRIGIGRPREKSMVEKYVLETMPIHEAEELQKTIFEEIYKVVMRHWNNIKTEEKKNEKKEEKEEKKATEKGAQRGGEVRIREQKGGERGEEKNRSSILKKWRTEDEDEEEETLRKVRTTEMWKTIKRRKNKSGEKRENSTERFLRKFEKHLRK